MILLDYFNFFFIFIIKIGCEDGKFGVNCIGICYCLNGVDDCRKIDGFCMFFICEWGWFGVFYC